MAVPLNITVSDPDWLPHTYDFDGGNLTFVHVPRAARADLIFLSEEYYKGQYPKETYPAADVAGAVKGSPSAPLHFIFHTSFCCSTLLAKALDVPGRIVSLAEPDVLIHLANRLIRSDDKANNERLDVALRLLARPYAAGDAVIVKPSNFANRLLVPALARDRRTRAVLLYSDLPTLLRSLAKKGIWGRIFGRQLYRNLAAWTDLKLGFGPVETFDQTDLQIAGLAWLMHIHQLHEAARQFGSERVLLLDSADFIADVPGTLDRTAQFLGLGLDKATIDAVASGPIFSTHSKLAQTSYSFDQRQRDHSAAETAHQEEIDVVVKWIAAVAGQSGLPLRPAFPST